MPKQLNYLTLNQSFIVKFSTKGSAKAPEVTKVAEATKIAQELAPEYAIDGELQFDASYVSSVAQLKAPNSKVAGEATVFVFPRFTIRKYWLQNCSTFR